MKSFTVTAASWAINPLISPLGWNTWIPVLFSQFPWTLVRCCSHLRRANKAFDNFLEGSGPSASTPTTHLSQARQQHRGESLQIYKEKTTGKCAQAACTYFLWASWHSASFSIKYLNRRFTFFNTISPGKYNLLFQLYPGSSTEH